MAHHVFLTGPKGVGKSTLIERVLTLHRGATGGFRTLRTQQFLSGRWTVHLFPVSGADAPSRENLLFVCGSGNDDTASRFDALGTAALSHSRETQLILMDELGPHEGDALRFRQAVTAALDGDIPVLGVLQQAPSPFLSEIAGHRNVTVIPISPENRDDPSLPARILSLLER